MFVIILSDDYPNYYFSGHYLPSDHVDDDVDGSDVHGDAMERSRVSEWVSGISGRAVKK